MLNNLMKGGLSITVVAALVIAVICFVPLVALWCINSLAELGGSSFYIDHNLYNYFVVFVAVFLVRGGSS